MHEGETDRNGRLEVPIPPRAERGLLVLRADSGPEWYELELGQLNACEEESAGLQQRLHNLGYPCEPTNVLDDQAQRALQQFQADEGLEPTGEADERTRRALQRAHGS